MLHLLTSMNRMCLTFQLFQNAQQLRAVVSLDHDVRQIPHRKQNSQNPAQCVLFDENGDKRLADSTLVALTIMIAESKPEEKEMMVTVVMNCLADKEQSEY